MGTELQVKYQRLAQEYAKLRSHVDVLKKAVRNEQATKTELQESLRERSLQLRKHVQENESLEFRNQQLSKRVALLQEDLNSPVKNKKRKDGFPAGVSEIHTQELAAKISENERLHMKILELTQKSERNISELEARINSLQAEVSTHNAVSDELSKHHSGQMERLAQDKAMLEARLAQQSGQHEEMAKTVKRLQLQVKEYESAAAAATADKEIKPLLDPDSHSFSALNVPIVDTKLQAEVVRALRSGLELVTTFTTQTSTLHSYLEQRCRAYPVDTAAGEHMTVVNHKLCELLHGSSAFTRPLVSTLTSYSDDLDSNPYSQDNSAELEAFAAAHYKFVGFLETLTPYLQLSLQEECSVSVCGAELTELNQRVSLSLPLLTASFSSLGDYISILVSGPARGTPQSSVAACVVKLHSSLQQLQHMFNAILGLFTSKISREHQLPTVSQKLNTTNECVVSSLTGLHSTTQQLCGFVESNAKLFASALESSGPESKQPSLSSVVLKLRTRASGFIAKLQLGSVESVPYTLAVYNAKVLSSSSESKETLLKQVTANHDRLAQLEQEKEQLMLDLQLLSIKHEREQKKVASLELARANPSSSSSPIGSPSLATPPAPLESQVRSLSHSLGSLSVHSTEAGAEEEVVDDLAMIRRHFVGRIAELNAQVQESDAKATHFYAECRALHKQLNHNTALKSKQAGDLQTASDTNQQLQDQLATTSSSYEKQLSTMSDHLCELNDRLLRQSEELEALQRSSKGKKKGK